MLQGSVAYSYSSELASRLTVVSVLAQAGSDVKQDGPALLRLARQAIDQQQYDVAERYVAQAESNWSKFRFSLGDTPQKVRRDIDAAKSRAAGVSRPSGNSRFRLASPFGSRKETTKSDPFKNAGQNVDALLGDKKGKASHYLRKGREAFASGDRVGAEHFAKLALEAGGQFGPQEDSPERLWNDLTGQAPARIAATRAPMAPPATAETGRGTLAFKSLPADTAPGRAQAAPPRALPPTTQLASPARTQGRPTASRAVYDPYNEQSRVVTAGGAQPAYPRTSQYDSAIQLVAGTEEAAPAAGAGDFVVRAVPKPGAPASTSASRSAPATPPAAAPRVAASPNRGVGEAIQAPRTQLYNGGAVPAAPAVQPAAAPSSVVRRAPRATVAGNASPGQRLMELGEQALRGGDPQRAAQLFREAAAHQNDLDPVTAQRLQDRLAFRAATSPQQPPSRLLQEASDEQLRIRQQINFDVKRRVSEAARMTTTDPKGAIESLNETARIVNESSLSTGDKQLLQALVDRRLAEVSKYMNDFRAEIELNETNAARLEDVDRRKRHRVEVDQRIAELVDEFNTLRDEERYAEAVLVAKKIRELAPREQISKQVWLSAQFIQRIMRNIEISEAAEDGFVRTLQSVEESSIPFDDTEPFRHGQSPTEWEALTQNRRHLGDAERKRHPSEIAIENALRKPVSLNFRETPLSEVVHHLKNVSGVNIYLDPIGLSEEGVHPSSPVSIDLPDEISIKSALQLILAQLRLSYVIQNEVLKITSEQLRDSNVYTKMYNVADLVIPLPNFAPHNQIGLPAALSQGYQTTLGSLGGSAPPPVMVNATPAGMPGGIETAEGLAQTIDSGGGFTTGGRGGATNADFDPLIELITTTIEPDTWEEAGGAGRVHEFETNLSLVVSQTQDVHDKIRDLLEQLRRLQDLQVTIEVRFITLSDDFFERIGVDFDFNIDDKSPLFNPDLDNQIHTSTIGLNQDGTQTDTLDIQVRQGSAAGLIPGGFAGFDPASAVGTSLGFAILSDIEAFFLIEASQSDSRTNLLQAPKVTLFNGQAASVSSQLQRPFVTSVVPVVGDFAAAQAPVIAVLPEGTTLSVQAVVSADRRYVRLTLVPFFSEIGDVETFTFTGSSTSTTNSSDESSDGGDTTSTSTGDTTTTAGTTIQLPEFAFTTVTTTVSVPDGGTVLLGGIKRLAERRTEQGTPILAKVPYLSRLFKNVGIGRETESLMLMVTPRIIIQEEEEKRIGL